MPPLAFQGRLPRGLHDGPTHHSNDKQNQHHPGGRFGEALREDLREDEEGELVAEGEEEARGGFRVDETEGPQFGVGPKGEGEGEGDQGDFVEARAVQVGDEGFLGRLVVGGVDDGHGCVDGGGGGGGAAAASIGAFGNDLQRAHDD